MIEKSRIFFQRIGITLLFITVSHCSFSQDAYIAVQDTTKSSGLFANFIGIKLYATDITALTANQNLQFLQSSNNEGVIYNLQHSMNLSGIKSFYNLGLGVDENLGKHLSINFLNTSLGYMQDIWDWSIGAGAGYFISLNKQGSMRLNASMNIYFESLTYNLGSYYDSTGLGFIVNGTNVGPTLRGIKYVNDIWSITPGLEFMYRRPAFDFFAGVYYNYVFTYSEKINFFKTTIPISDAIYYPNSTTPVSRDITNLGRYTIQVGIIREFGI